MAVTLLKIMEQVGSRETSKIASYVNDGLKELAGSIEDKVERSNIDIVSGTRFYSLPSSMYKLIGVFQRLDEDDDKYIRISRIKRLDIIQDSLTSSISNDDDIIIV